MINHIFAYLLVGAYVAFVIICAIALTYSIDRSRHSKKGRTMRVIFKGDKEKIRAIHEELVSKGILTSDMKVAKDIGTLRAIDPICVELDGDDIKVTFDGGYILTVQKDLVARVQTWWYDDSNLV